MEENVTVTKRKVIVLVGSTRFKGAHEKAALHETLLGNIVLAPSVYPHADRITLTHEQKLMLDEIQLDKIRLADEVYVINVNGYVGETTRAEILFAMKIGKPIRFLVPEKECA